MSCKKQTPCNDGFQTWPIILLLVILLVWGPCPLSHLPCTAALFAGYVVHLMVPASCACVWKEGRQPLKGQQGRQMSGQTLAIKRQNVLQQQEMGTGDIHSMKMLITGPTAKKSFFVQFRGRHNFSCLSIFTLFPIHHTRQRQTLSVHRELGCVILLLLLLRAFVINGGG